MEVKKYKNINNDSLEKLLLQNLDLNKKIYASCQKTEKYIFFIKAFSIIKFILILVPVIIGVFYLIPFIANFIDIYKSFFHDLHLEEIKESLDSLNNIHNLPNL